jgi:SAM-dependent methyltransferase
MVRETASFWTKANLPTWDERAAIHYRDASGFYAIDRFRQGGDTLFPIEAAEVGSVGGKRLAHLQCHIGLDTLSLARRGAEVSGLDFSPVAIEAARELALETNLPATFVQADVYDALYVLKGPFDIVFVSWGSLNWLPDIWLWAKIVAGLLAPGGYLYLAEQHPAISVMKEIEGRLVPAFAWRTPRFEPVVSDVPNSYTGEQLVNSRVHEWEHPLSDIVGSLLEAGLRLDFFHEHEVLPWPRFPMMEPVGRGLYRLPKWQIPMPLAFSLKASKPAAWPELAPE